MLKVLRRNSLILRAGVTYRRKKNSAVWEIEEQPKNDEGVIFYYEDPRPSLHIY